MACNLELTEALDLLDRQMLNQWQLSKIEIGR